VYTFYVVYRATATGTRSPSPCTGSHDDWLACVTAMATGQCSAGRCSASFRKMASTCRRFV